MANIIYKYFPDLSALQRNQMALLEELYRDWNSKINIVSRKDIDMLYTHHVLHSLAIAKVIQFAKDTKVVDIGTGGGFPGIPLAIMFPYVQFTLVDSIGKKILVAQEIANALQLQNVATLKSRAEEMNGKYDFVVTRAVAPLPVVANWTRKLVKPGGYNFLPNGILALKGGNLKEELAPLGRKVEKWKISDFFEEDYFIEKFAIFLPIY